MEPKLTVGETLRETFSIYRDRVGVLLPVAFWLFLAVGIVEELTSDVLSLFWIGIVVSLAAGTLYQGIVVGLVKEANEGRRDSSLRDLVDSVLPVLWRLVGAGLLAGVGIAGGLFLLIAPGLYLLTVWAVVAPVIVVERRKVTDAFGRSRQLVRGSGWPVLGAVATGFLVAVVATLGLTAIATAIVEGAIAEVVFTALAQMVAAPVAALIASVLYFRLLEIDGQRPQQPPDLPPRLP